jgi:hypothetical protein
MEPVGISKPGTYAHAQHQTEKLRIAYIKSIWEALPNLTRKKGSELKRALSRGFRHVHSGALNFLREQVQVMLQNIKPFAHAYLP